jgi:hypothetical protein
VRIVGEGAATHWRVYDAQTGEMIPGVRAVVIKAAIDEAPTAELTVVVPKVDVTLEARIHGVCPYCGQEKPAS